jgi:hypothetical protein
MAKLTKYKEGDIFKFRYPYTREPVEVVVTKEFEVLSNCKSDILDNEDNFQRC